MAEIYMFPQRSIEFHIRDHDIFRYAADILSGTEGMAYLPVENEIDYLDGLFLRPQEVAYGTSIAHAYAASFSQHNQDTLFSICAQIMQAELFNYTGVVVLRDDITHAGEFLTQYTRARFEKRHILDLFLYSVSVPIELGPHRDEYIAPRDTHQLVADELGLFPRDL